MKKIPPLLLLSASLFWGCTNRPLVESDPAPRSTVSSDISNQHITSFGEDEFGYVWIGTSRGLNRFNGTSFYQFFNSKDSTGITDNQIKKIFRDSQNRLWVSTVDGIGYYTDQNRFHNIDIQGLSRNVIDIFEDGNGVIYANLYMQICKYDPKTDKFYAVINLDPDDLAGVCLVNKKGELWTVSVQKVNVYDLSNFGRLNSIRLPQPLNYAYFQKNGLLWMVDTNGQLTLLNTANGQFSPLPSILTNHPLFSKSTVQIIHQFDDENLLFYTLQNGFFIYNSVLGSVIHQSENGFPFESPDFDITCLFTDSNKNLWIGSHDKGFTVKYYYKQRFNSNLTLRSSLANKSVVAVRSNKGFLWIATRKDGVYCYNEANNSIAKVSTKSVFHQKEVHSLFIDSNNKIWLLAANELARCSYKNGQFIAEFKTQFTYYISNIVEDRLGTMWVAGVGETIYALKKGATAFTSMQLFPKGFTFTNSIITLKNGQIAVAAFGHNLILINPSDWSVKEIDVNSHIKRSKFIPTALYQDGEGNIWIATLGNGLFKYNTTTNVVEPMPNPACSDISSFAEDIQGNMWVGTLFGLSRWNKPTKSFINYYSQDGIGGNQFNERSATPFVDNTLVFGGTHGLTVFNPFEVVNNRHISIHFDDLKVHNQPVEAGDNSSIAKAMAYSPTIKLTHNQNSFTISFSAVDYSEFPRIRYHYQLEGFDKQWTDAQNSNQAVYSNVPSGKYTFRVKAYSIDNVYLDAESSVQINILKAPWLTWYALLIYSLLAMSVILTILHLYVRVKNNRSATLLALREKEQEQHINQMNMSYFSNISHEFRTPLTMISGPIAVMAKDDSISGESRQMLHIVQRNINRMLRLVNQMLDFNKLENDTLRLNISKTDVIGLIKQTIEIFTLNAQEKGVSLKTYGLEDDCISWIDGDKLEKITVNLISNALKFSSPGGAIELRFDVVGHDKIAEVFNPTDKLPEVDYILVKISDRGPGIPPDKLEDVFKRYYQIDHRSEKAYNWGTGIGLYFAKRLVELHHGFIKAANRDGGGCSFSFALPVNEKAYHLSEIINQPEQTHQSMVQLPPVPLSEPTDIIDSESPTLLVIDDDTEVTYYLKSLLASKYNVENKFDAESAFKCLEELSPDLIICDVLMPGTSGYEFCKKVKENPSFCHIPVILLTAKSTVENQVEGLNVGADAYVTKPFDPGYLLALINSQLKNREMVRHMLSKTTDTQKIDDLTLSPQDKAFMDSLYQLMERELSNTELNITSMTETLKISRTKFYYKVKGLTGLNPNVFFKNYKLNRAAQLVLEGKHNVSEIADITGFSTLSHFSVSFKKHFGVNPSDYRS